MDREYILAKLTKSLIEGLLKYPENYKEVIYTNLNAAMDIQKNYLNKPQTRNKPVDQYDSNGKLIDSFTSVTQAANRTGIGRANISEAINNKQNTAGGFHWKPK